MGQIDNAVSWYARDINTGDLSYVGMLRDGMDGVDGLSTAFSVEVSADGNHIYALGMDDDSVSWYVRDINTGDLSYGGMLKDGIDGVDGLNAPSACIISPDGKHVYVTALNDNSVGWFERNATTGGLTFLGLLKDGLNGADGLWWPNGITLTNDGKFAYVTAAKDNSLSWYERNATTGAVVFYRIIEKRR